MLVRPGAQKITSYQTNKTLLLSEGSGVDTKPQLEIYADDVKCGHGAAIGQIDPEALFYLKTRGLDDEQANEMLAAGFTSEIIQTIKHIPLRVYFDQLIHTRLHELHS
jgi:Fe-S cluster assembly protein SufD